MTDIDMPQGELVRVVAEEISEAGGRAFWVGGAVRDHFMGREPVDYDIEVHGLQGEQLLEILGHHGKAVKVGKSFANFLLTGVNADWSIPDPPSETPSGGDWTDAVREAALRRDLTINALAVDVLDGSLHDPFDGLEDLERKRLRWCDKETFGRDPLRLLRVMQFIARFEFEIEPELTELCKGLDLSDVTPERIDGEFDKLLLKSSRPSLGIFWLGSMQRLGEWLSPLQRFVVPQLFERLLALDRLAIEAFEDEERELAMLWAVLGAGFKDQKPGDNFIQRARVLKWRNLLIECHDELLKGDENVDYLLKKLAHRLGPDWDLHHLFLLEEALAYGEKHAPPVSLRIRSMELGIIHGPEQELVKSGDLNGITEPGPQMGELLRKAYEMQTREGISDKAEILKRLND